MMPSFFGATGRHVQVLARDGEGEVVGAPRPSRVCPVLLLQPRQQAARRWGSDAARPHGPRLRLGEMCFRTTAGQICHIFSA